ncbi:CDP-alcohol phosphatidyltransferase family protein [Clostridium sp.]|uniref:CDP-alcohol phosphatidyltransferase family protein n=1 Tax=Clostridium sp. TaxID=1506 RepID=UPI001A622379|nr:CDP-alcohol phosphatidyltransferase family protein [Clostridium sp.]MBK5241225.1 CDP-alcohol phosphatidyltransferase family protein [Clostridium sp.]
MIDTRWRGRFEPMFNFLARILVSLKIKPNAITIVAFAIGLFSAIFIGFNKPIVALILLWISGLLDALDGSVARLTGKSSPQGAYMDLIFDRMVEAFIILGFTILAPANYIAYILFYISVIFNFTTFIVAGALFKNASEKSMHYDTGIAERTETFIVFSLMLIFTNHITIILMLFNGIIFFTGIIRFHKVIKYSKTSGRENHEN